MDQHIKNSISELNTRFVELEHILAEQAGQSRNDPKAYQALAKELVDLREIVIAYRDFIAIQNSIAEAKEVTSGSDPELIELGKEELINLINKQEELESNLIGLWEARNELPGRPIIIEIRAGTGGLEASLFAADLYRMYTRFAASCGLEVEDMQSSISEAGGFKEISFAVKGKLAWKLLRFESGVHRVQRVPETEASGRIHTSTVTVAVLQEPEEIDLPTIPMKDLEIDVYRSSGPGGQGVNTTDSAVRIHHIPTGLIVTCQDERSQLRNKDKALRVLRARLLDRLEKERHAEIASDRKRQVGTGERSEKIRTYNFPDRRVTDHRIGLTLYNLDRVLEGAMQELVDALNTHKFD